MVLAVAPGNLLDDDAAAAAIDAPHGVQQKDQKSPERNELETPLGELIVTGRGLMAARANRRRTLARTHGDLDALLVGTEAGLLVNKPGRRWQRFRIVMSSMARKMSRRGLPK